ncbi:MAG: ABC transporter ATP-binding protein [Firmicutes bacterium]|nr:ABC transporter ATP-binding protein [Bacillota bacterium]
MIKYFQKKYAMSEKGAKDLIHSIIWTIVMDISFMIPVILGFKFLDDYLSFLLNASHNPGSSILYYVIMSVAFFLVMLVIAYFQYNSTYTKIYEESARRRISLAETLRKLPLAFFGKKDIADLSSTIMEDATQIEMLFSHAVPQLYAAGLTVLIIGVMMFFYNWQLSLAVFWVVPVAVLVFYLSRKFQNRMQAKLYSVKREISDNIQEGLDLAHEIKSYNREEIFANTLNSKLDNYEKFLIKGELLIGAFINLSYVFLKLGLPSVILYGAYLLSIGSVNIFTYLVFLVVTARIYNPIMDAMNNLALLLFLNVRINRMKEMDEMPRQEGKSEFYPKNYDIEFKNVDFSYQDGVQTLKDVSFTAKQGDVTALVGPSGGGKSTVARLSARFWDIDKGVITLGGEDISLVDPETLLNNFSIVFQDVTLFNSSVMENIRLGKRDATDEEVIKAAQLAQCDEFVKKLPQGYDTLIGENGERLSGGERQRISIARAILKNAPIILLDEATASLDAENESKIQSALSALVKNKTVLIIAHRMRTVLGADKIVVIKDGAIAETGTPLELKEKQGIFSSMLKKQYQNN